MLNVVLGTVPSPGSGEMIDAGVVMVNERIRKALKPGAVAEIQAIAIYEAECFWIRDKARNALLVRIRDEEKAHAGFLADWVGVPGWERSLNRWIGWGVGTALAILPWRALCRVQAWAEREASRIYETALRELERLPEEEVDARLSAGLREAAHSEMGHAESFTRAIYEI